MTAWVEFCGTHYRPMAPRPEATCTPPWEILEAAQPVDMGALLGALAGSFVPDPGRSREQAQRWQHANPAALSESALIRERAGAAVLLTWQQRPTGARPG
jgi:hypothetical protein